MRRLWEDQRLIPYRVQMADMVFLFAVLSGIAGSYLVSYTGIARDHYQLGILFSELVYFLPVGIFFWLGKEKRDLSFRKKKHKALQDKAGDGGLVRLIFHKHLPGRAAGKHAFPYLGEK